MKPRVLLSWVGMLGPAAFFALDTAASPAADPPAIVPLPNGFRPAGIACGRGQTAYVGSSDSGAIYAIDLATGQGRILVAVQQPQGVLGLAYDARTNYLYAAGGSLGNALVYDAASGALVHDIQLTTDPGGLVQDVAITHEALYFTDAGRPVLYRLNLAADGVLGATAPVQEVMLCGDFVFVEEDLNASGVVASTDGLALVAVHTALGTLYRVDPLTGSATLIDLGDTFLKDSSGLALDDTTLYVVNFNNRIYRVDLDPTLHAGRVHGTIAGQYFDNPSAAVVAGNTLYVVNARVATEPLPETEYWLTSITLS